MAGSHGSLHRRRNCDIPRLSGLSVYAAFRRRSIGDYHRHMVAGRHERVRFTTRSFYGPSVTCTAAAATVRPVSAAGPWRCIGTIICVGHIVRAARAIFGSTRTAIPDGRRRAACAGARGIGFHTEQVAGSVNRVTGLQTTCAREWANETRYFRKSIQRLDRSLPGR